jgi:hypothetical protein
VVALEAVGAPAVDARSAQEPRRRSEVQRGPQLGWEVTSEMAHRADLDAVVDDGLQERVSCRFLRDVDRDRTDADDVTRFVVVGVTAAPCVEASDARKRAGVEVLERATEGSSCLRHCTRHDSDSNPLVLPHG